MLNFAKIIIISGIVITLIGLILLFLGKFFNLGKLPGDLLLRKGNFTFYFPLTTCLIVSLVLSAIFWLWIKR